MSAPRSADAAKLGRPGAMVNLQKLTPWRYHYKGPSGRKVMRDETLPADANIYHRLEWRFAQLIFQNAQLRLSPVRDWLDPYEGWWCDELFTRPGTPLEGVNAYAVCWTVSKYDEPAWRMVGYGRSEPIVRIRCSVRALLDAAQHHLGANAGSWFIGGVRYKRIKTLRTLSDRLHTQEPDRLKHVGRTAASLLIRKRNAFCFEKEVRLLFLDERGTAPRTEVMLPIDPRIVTDVMTSPYAEDQRRLVTDGLKPFGRRPRKSLVMSPPSWMMWNLWHR